MLASRSARVDTSTYARLHCANPDTRSRPGALASGRGPKSREEAALGRLPTYLESLSHRDFLTLWTASMSAGAAAWALIVARGWLVYAETASPVWVGVVTFAAMAPRVLVTPFTGYLSDRFDRRIVVAAMFAINMTHNVALGVMVLADAAPVWALVSLAFVNGSARAAMMPASQALIPNLVPRRLLLNAIALNQAAGHGSRLAGPLAILLLLPTLGFEATFFLCSGLYLVGFVQVLRIRTPSTGRIDPGKSLAANFGAGLTYMYRNPTLLAIVLLALFHCGLTMSFESLLPVLSSQQFQAEEAGFSYMMMAVGAGALVSVFLLAGLGDGVSKGRLLLNLGVLSGLSPVVLAAAVNMPMALLGAAAMGATQAGFMTLTHTMIQTIVPDGVRGRVGAIYSVHIGGMMAIANLYNGVLADYIDAPLVLGVAGVAFIVVMFVTWFMGVFRRIYAGGLPSQAASHAAVEGR